MAYVFFAVVQAVFIFSGLHESYQTVKKLRLVGRSHNTNIQSIVINLLLEVIKYTNVNLLKSCPYSKYAWGYYIVTFR